jgi:hypothetical protein
MEAHGHLKNVLPKDQLAFASASTDLAFASAASTSINRITFSPTIFRINLLIRYWRCSCFQQVQSFQLEEPKMRQHRIVSTGPRV